MPKTPLNSHKPGKEPTQFGKKCPPFKEAAIFYIDNKIEQKRALDFAEWLKANKMSPITGNNGYNWHIRFKYIQNNKSGTYNGCYHCCPVQHMPSTKDWVESSGGLDFVIFVHKPISEFFVNRAAFIIINSS